MTRSRNAFLLILATLAACGVPGTLLAAQVKVESMRTWQAPDNTRIVLDLSAPADYHMFRMHKPERLVIDMKGGRLPSRKGLQVPADDRLLKKVRTGYHSNDTLRVVLDLHQAVTYKSFLLKPYKQYGNRLVVDLFPVATAARAPQAAPPQPKVVAKPTGMRDLVIAIDAGHGGEDPGALGYRGTREKDVVLGIAKQLAALVEKERGMKPLLVRKGDYFLSLRKRTRIAREHKADLFVSIHADSFRDKRVQGTSVYVLSQNGATDEAARFLADKENASDLIGGVSLEDKDDVLASVLLDLSQSATLESSLDAADYVLKSLRGVGRLHKREVQQAGFAVLKSPDIPSMLIETAYISNPSDERNLNSRSHQRRMAQAILGGVRGYFAHYAPPGTLYASRKHVIARGDTLSEIAQHYRVSVANIKNFNQLHSSTVRVGQVLRIPPGNEG